MKSPLQDLLKSSILAVHLHVEVMLVVLYETELGLVLVLKNTLETHMQAADQNALPTPIVHQIKPVFKANARIRVVEYVGTMRLVVYGIMFQSVNAYLATLVNHFQDVTKFLRLLHKDMSPHHHKIHAYHLLAVLTVTAKT